MSILGLHITVLNDEQHAIVKKALADAGHEIIAAQHDVLSTLWNEAADKFPGLIEGVRKGIADLRDSTLSGGDKAVKVAEDVLAVAPAVIAALPKAKDFLVHGVTLEFAKMEDALVTAAGGLIGKLATAEADAELDKLAQSAP